MSISFYRNQDPVMSAPVTLLRNLTRTHPSVAIAVLLPGPRKGRRRRQARELALDDFCRTPSRTECETRERINVIFLLSQDRGRRSTGGRRP